VFGEGFAAPGSLTLAQLVGGRLPTELSGACVEFNGVRAPLFALTAGQINVQAPNVPASGSVRVSVKTKCGQAGQRTSRFMPVPVAAAAPEFFFFVGSVNGVNPVAAVNFTRGGNVGMPGLIAGGAFEPARPGDVLILFATGLGPTNPSFEPGQLATGIANVIAPVRVRVGDIEAQVTFAGLTPGFAGLNQINMVLPANTPAGNVPITITVGSGAQAVSTSVGAFLTITR
jgi:uncharacterized protein (TIGR03437 family)